MTVADLPANTTPDTFEATINAYLRDQRQYGQINSENTERAYGSTLRLHAQDSASCGPLGTDREHVKLTLARWENPNSRSRGHSVLTSFYDWMLTEGYRKDNPARQVRKAKVSAPSVYRLTRSETRALIDACETQRERRVILIGLCTGARVNEMVGLQLHHFQRPGYVWFSKDITKGGRERYVPVLPELEPIVQEILTDTLPARYVIETYVRGGNLRTPTEPTNRCTVGRIVKEVARRAGITANIHPHLLRHAYGDHVAKRAGLHAAQTLMGHASVTTTAQVYVDKPDLDELTASVQGLDYCEASGDRRESIVAELKALAVRAKHIGIDIAVLIEECSI